MPSFPTTLITRNALLRPKNNIDADLAAPLDASQTNVTVGTGQGVRFQVAETFAIANEAFYVSSILGDVLTVVRGYDGTTPAVHASGFNVIKDTPLAAHHNLPVDELYALLDFFVTGFTRDLVGNNFTITGTRAPTANGDLGNKLYIDTGDAANAAALAAHIAAVDPHPQYLTPAEGNAAYDPLGAAAAAQAFAIQRANHTGTQLAATISDLSTLTVPENTNLYYTQARFDAAFAAKSTTNLTEGTNLYYTQGRFDAAFALKSTTNLAEGTNLYYTSTRFNSAFAAKTTTDLAEGTNLYYTTARFDLAFNGKSTTDLAEGTNLYYTAARFNTAFAAKSTSDLAEGTNLYYTQGRFDSAFAAKLTALVTFTGGVAITTADLTITDRNVVLAAATGTQWATAASQKQSWWGATPIVQPTTGVASATRVAGAGTSVLVDDTYDGYTLAQVVRALRNEGLLA